METRQDDLRTLKARDLIENEPRWRNATQVVGEMSGDRTINKLALIAGISSLDELKGYEAQAKARGITGEELAAIYKRRKALTPKKRRGARG